ncbi:hypothetical protein J6590_049212 [Homalodisca vitripennis]|nr:hypothetical protein J6590_049212 [Homalodisca vitripennis]
MAEIVEDAGRREALPRTAKVSWYPAASPAAPLGRSGKDKAEGDNNYSLIFPPGEVQLHFQAKKDKQMYT